MGAGLAIAGVRATAICELGAGTTEVAVISRSGTLAARSTDVGGRALDAAIAARFGLARDEAERLKIEIGSAVTMPEPLTARVGTDEVTSNEIAAAIRAPLEEIAAMVRLILADLRPPVAAEVRDHGLVLSGGGARLRGIERFLAERGGIVTRIASEPETSVVRGAALALENFEVLKRNQTYLR